MAVVADSSQPDEILDRTCAEARKLFGARAAAVVPAAEGEALEARRDRRRDPRARSRAGAAPIGTLELRALASASRAAISCARRCSPTSPRARSRTPACSREAHEREAERARLTERLITAEQDERRRLSIFLHDGPLQSMSGIALMHDAALAALRRAATRTLRR